MRKAEKFWVDHEAVLEFSISEFGSYDANSLAFSAKHLTLERIAQEVEKEHPEVADKLRSWDVTSRANDPRLNLLPLDVDLTEFEEKDRAELIQEVFEYVKGGWGTCLNAQAVEGR